MVLSQIVRLEQTTAAGWIVCDYAGRIGALLVLAAIPAARAIAFQRQPLRVSWGEVLLWMAALVLIDPFFSRWLVPLVNSWISHTRIGHYVAPSGWLNLLDLSFGLALVAVHEEIVFRRCARAVLSLWWGDGAVMVMVSSLLFAAYHWTTGLGNIVAVFFFGLYAMLFYKRVGALWPMMVAHFLVDLVDFSGVINYL